MAAGRCAAAGRRRGQSSYSIYRSVLTTISNLNLCLERTDVGYTSKFVTEIFRRQVMQAAVDEDRQFILDTVVSPPVQVAKKWRCMWTVGGQPSFLIDSIEYLFISCIATRLRPRILLVTRLYLGPLYDQYFMINDLVPVLRAGRGGARSRSTSYYTSVVTNNDHMLLTYSECDDVSTAA